MQTMIINTFAWAGQEMALLSIFHAGTNGRFLVKGFEVVPNSPMRSGGAIDVKRYLRRCSAVSGGFAVPARKANLGNTDLPSQIKILRRPDAVTFTSGNIFRSLILCPQSLAGLTLRSGGRLSGSGAWNGTGDIWTTSRSAIVQGIVLREGEGFAFGTSNSQLPVYPFSFFLTATLRNIANNQTYYIATQLAPEEMKESSFVIMNESGSGITLEIVDMEICDLGSVGNTLPYDCSYLRFLQIDRADGGTTVTPSKMNEGDGIPASLVVKKNYVEDDLRVVLRGHKSGFEPYQDLSYPQTYIPVRKMGTYGTRLAWQGAVGGVGINSFFSPIMPGKYVFGGMEFKSGREIVLNPGEGFAIAQSNNTGYAEFYIEAKILYDPPTTQGFPVVGNSGLVKVA